MIEAAKDARHEFGALPIVESKEAVDKQAVRPDAGNAGMAAIIAPYGEQVQRRAWLTPRLQRSRTIPSLLLIRGTASKHRIAMFAMILL